MCGLQIDVSKNQVRTLKKNFYRPPIELDVSQNRLKKLPTAKSKKKNYIHSIDASHNVIAKLPPRMNNLVCMTRLDLSNNNLHEVRCARYNHNQNEKKRSERRIHCAPKTFAPPQIHFPGAQDGQNLISWRWSLPAPIDPVW